VRIDPATGSVNVVLDASSLRSPDVNQPGQVLSGIAHIDGDEFLLTGKNWPSMLRVRIPA
jgi:glutamine cyclotransferase